MSDSDFMEIDYDTELLYHKGSDVEEDPAPALPADELEPLVCGEDQLYADSQLEQSADEPLQVPAPQSPTLMAAQRISRANLPDPPLEIPDWSEEVRVWEEDNLQEVEDEEERLLDSDAEEE